MGTRRHLACVPLCCCFSAPPQAFSSSEIFYCCWSIFWAPEIQVFTLLVHGAFRCAFTCASFLWDLVLYLSLGPRWFIAAAILFGSLQKAICAFASHFPHRHIPVEFFFHTSPQPWETTRSRRSPICSLQLRTSLRLRLMRTFKTCSLP